MPRFTRFGLTLLTLGLALTGSLASAHAQTEQPGALVKVGHYTASTDFLNLSQYYQTTKRTTIRVAYVPTRHFGKRTMRTLTLPKGTIVAGSLTTRKVHNRLTPALLIYASRLSHYRLAMAQPAGYTVDPAADTDATPTVITQTAHLKAFKRVACPRYMPAYSHGDLYVGGVTAALSPEEPTATSLRVTPDGYVELLTYDQSVRAGLGFYQHPTSQAKIYQTRFNDPLRQLYVRHDLPGLNLTRVRTSGLRQYRLTIKNLHRPQHISGSPLKGIAGTFDSLYQVGGTPYYTFIGFDGASD